jgi:predicted RND superfamily exporter protein
MRGYIGWVLRYRWLVIVLTVVISAVVISQARNLRIIIDPNTLLPQSQEWGIKVQSRVSF